MKRSTGKTRAHRFVTQARGERRVEVHAAFAAGLGKGRRDACDAIKGHSRRQNGYVLLMVLLVLAVAGTALAFAVRVNCRQAVSAANAQRTLQRRWGVDGCRTLCLPRAELLLHTLGDPSARKAVMRRRLKLGGETFVLILADEQAKINVNALTEADDPAAAVERVRRLLTIGPNAPVVRPRPAETLLQLQQNGGVRFASFDQIFAYDRPSQLVSVENMAAAPASRITCWGDGRVNFKRAEERILRERIGELIPAKMTELVGYSIEHPDGTLVEAVAALELPVDTATAVTERLTDESTCHSLWIIVEETQRLRHHLFIRNGGGGGGGGQRRFSW